ncbi:N-acetylmuramoyl-L-alanine amidase family protein [Helicobacter japonicus]|uniref:N-acetylmuramoyl-L-alanine amidase family protein n=1 Tax=Helicobacter japonicus TaxID=425400 RepID=UPI0023F381AA|nr:N-acetylmuramoyl-L-alanine amidase [Helicobacter japonicus]
MLRIVASLCLLFLCLWGENRIIRMVPFGDGNVKIVFAQDISDLTWQIKNLQGNKSFIDFEANLTIPRRNFIFKDNSTLQIAQNTPQVVRAVIATNPKSTYEVVKEKENLYIFIKPKGDSKQVAQSPKENLSTKSQIDDKQTSQHKQEQIAKNPPQKVEQKSKKIVVDAGHGGKDCGTKSVENICEKVIVLSVAKILRDELKSRGYAVYMTRDSDVYIDLRKRTEFANTKSADLFVSVHANSIPKTSAKTANGVETYFLSPARSERAEQVAKAENQGDIETMSHFATKSFLNTISAFHLVASHKLAIEIQSGILNQVRTHYNTHDGAVREGPFWVLAGALMPSVLIEIGYASHKNEGKLIAKKEYQKLLAKGIADGIDGYFLRNY